MTNQEAIVSEEDTPTEDKVLLQQAQENAKDAWNLWYNSSITQKFLLNLTMQRDIFLSSASNKSYSQGLVDNNQLTKAETIRKVVEYAKTGNADF